MNKDKDKNNKIFNKILTFLSILLIIALTALIILFMYKSNKESNSEENVLTYSELLNEINNDSVEKIEMTVGSTTLKVKLKDVEKEKTAIIPNTEVFIETIQPKLEEKQIELEQKQRSIISQLPSYIFSMLPTLIMVALFIMIFKMQGLGDKGEVYNDTERR